MEFKFNIGDRVYLQKFDQDDEVNNSGRLNWNPLMTKYIGSTGIITRIRKRSSYYNEKTIVNTVYNIFIAPHQEWTWVESALSLYDKNKLNTFIKKLENQLNNIGPYTLLKVREKGMFKEGDKVILKDFSLDPVYKYLFVPEMKREVNNKPHNVFPCYSNINSYSELYDIQCEGNTFVWVNTYMELCISPQESFKIVKNTLINNINNIINKFKYETK